MSDDAQFIFGLLLISGLVGAVVGKYMFRRKGRDENMGAIAGAIPSMISALAGLSFLGVILFAVVAYFIPAKEPTNPSS